MGIADPMFTVEGLRSAGLSVPDVRFEDEIRRFAQADRTNPPPQNGILFVGDSDIRLWSDGGRLETDFAPLPVFNRGFGGARIWETLLYFPRIVLPYQPRTIVYICGDNDICALGGAGPRNVQLGFDLFLRALIEHVPALRQFYYLAIHPSPATMHWRRRQIEANDHVRKLCQDSDVAQFVDYLHLLLDANGRPRPECFRPDGLHFAARFYEQLAGLLRPMLEAGSR